MQTNLLKQNWHGFIKLCLKMKAEKQLSELFDLFLTDAEKEDIAVRHAIVGELLLGKKTQRGLAKQFKISIAKITRGSNALRIADPKIKKLIAI
jgi:TrpR family transcriptional regulator, trp operon repressor